MTTPRPWHGPFASSSACRCKRSLSLSPLWQPGASRPWQRSSSLQEWGAVHLEPEDFAGLVQPKVRNEQVHVTARQPLGQRAVRLLQHPFQAHRGIDDERHVRGRHRSATAASRPALRPAAPHLRARRARQCAVGIPPGVPPPAGGLGLGRASVLGRADAQLSDHDIIEIPYRQGCHGCLRARCHCCGCYRHTAPSPAATPWSAACADRLEVGGGPGASRAPSRGYAEQNGQPARHLKQRGGAQVADHRAGSVPRQKLRP
jgi:hypothetical protein